MGKEYDTRGTWDGIYIAAMAVGAISGLICATFRYTVAQIAGLRPYMFSHSNHIIVHVVVFCSIFTALYITRWLVEMFPKSGGSGLPQTQALMYGRRVYNTPFIYLAVKFIGGVLSLSSGLSLGREGTSVQMGSLTGYITGNLLHTKEGKKRHLIAAGAGAGVAAAFTAPLSSSILIMESLQKVTITTTLLCTLLAGAVAGVIAKFITPDNIYDLIPVVTPKDNFAVLIPIYVAMALFFALFGKLFSNMLLKGKEIYAKMKAGIQEHGKGRGIFKEVMLLASATWLMGLVFTEMIGGDQTFLVKESVINSFLASEVLHSQIITRIVNLLILLMVIVAIWSFTVLSHSSGFPGGIFLPMMTVGGLLGKLFYEAAAFVCGTGYIGEGLGGYFILLGMSAFFIAVVRTPITGFILISEMTGHYETFFPTLIIGTLVYFLTQTLRVEPLNDMLYDFMIEHDTMQPERTTVYIDIERSSYLKGKQICHISLPDGAAIKEIVRNKKTIPVGPTTTVEEGDQIGIELDSKDIERLYRSLICLGS